MISFAGAHRVDSRVSCAFSTSWNLVSYRPLSSVEHNVADNYVLQMYSIVTCILGGSVICAVAVCLPVDNQS